MEIDHFRFILIGVAMAAMAVAVVVVLGPSSLGRHSEIAEA